MYGWNTPTWTINSSAIQCSRLVHAGILCTTEIRFKNLSRPWIQSCSNISLRQTNSLVVVHNLSNIYNHIAISTGICGGWRRTRASREAARLALAPALPRCSRSALAPTKLLALRARPQLRCSRCSLAALALRARAQNYLFAEEHLARKYN